MAHAEGVVLAFLAARERREAVLLLDRGDAVAAAGEDLVRVALVADVPHQAIVRGVELVVQGHGQLDHAQARAEVTAGAGDGLDQILAQFVGDLRQFVVGQPAQVGGRVDRSQAGIMAEVIHPRIVGPAAGRSKGETVNKA